MTDFVSHRYTPNPELCEHDFQPIRTWREKLRWDWDKLIVTEECDKCGYTVEIEYNAGNVRENE